MDNNTKDKISIHIVNSVKGGCGKTAFSLFKALELAKETRKESAVNGLGDAPVIWIDADFKGTASKVSFYGKDKETFQIINARSIDKLAKEVPDLFSAPSAGTDNRLCFKQKYVQYTINDYLKEDINEYEKIIAHGYAYCANQDDEEVQEDKKDARLRLNGAIDFIFSSPRITDKKAFNYGESMPAIEIGRFTYRMEILMKNLIEIGRVRTRADKESQRKSEYGHIVIDMPPGDDMYSNALLHMLRQFAENRVEEKDYEIDIYLYTLTTSDKGHRYAMTESLKDTLQVLKKYEHKETVYAVLSEIRYMEFGDDERRACIEEIKQIDEDEDINIVLCKYQQDYYEYCRNLEMNEFAYKLITLKESSKKNEVANEKSS